MERIKRHLRSAAGYQAVCAKWLVLAALVGCVVGPLGGAFGLALNWANATRGAHPWLLYLLPVDRKSTRLNSSHWKQSRMPSSA